MKKNNLASDGDCPAEVNFSGGVRGKYAGRLAKGARFPDGNTVIVLDSDVVKVFPTQKAVNDALRSLAEIINRNKKAEGKVSPKPRIVSTK